MTILSGATSSSLLALQVLLLSLLACSSVLVDGQELYEPVCPLDFSLIQTNESSEGTTQRRLKQRRRSLEETVDTSPVEIIKQSGDSVEFVISNTTPNSDHFFVSYETDVFHSQHCLMFEEETTTTEVITASCFDTHTEYGNISLVRVYVRSSVSTGGSTVVPACCHDPYEGTEASELFTTTEYIYEISCSPSCDDPDNYYDESPTQAPTEGELQSPPAGFEAPTDVPTGTPTTQSPTKTPTNSPTVSPTTQSPTKTPTNSPTVSPTKTISEAPTDVPTGTPTTQSPTKAPTKSPTVSPTAFPTASPTAAPQQQQMCSKEATSILSRDLVMGSQKNGPHWGSRHPWAWPTNKSTNNAACGWFQGVDDEGAGAYAWPCAVDGTMVNNRVLAFDSSYLNFEFGFDQGMKATISLADSATGEETGEETISFFASGSSGNSCSAPKEGNWDDYPVRLVKSGRYYHHWYAEKVGCNGDSDDTRVEIKVTPDCVELHMVSKNGADNMNWLDADSQTPLESSSNGYSAISYCVECDSEASDDSSDLSGCSLVKKPIPTDCCSLNPAGDRDGSMLCGTGWEYGICGASSLVTTSMTQDVSLSTVPSYPITADGHSFQVAVPKGSGSQMTNDDLTAVINNDSDTWKKVKINFHIVRPRRVTGVSGVLLDASTGEPTGIHVQMSKNWHENRPGLYDSYWWTGIAHFRVPPGETRLDLVVAYQYYEGLHGVSHSQLSLLGWATNGLWEEVGLGSNGESITYEPHGHHRRQMILDTRPWLVCQMGTTCNGSPDNTQWTENHGGGDFLNAVDDDGFYQYLVEDTVYHTMNGPRLTNATYAGVTVDRNIAVSRTVSTWTADDFVRHLHSFEYTFQQDTPGDHYPRFAMYTLGGDNYNYVQFPLFAYGSGNENAFLEASASNDATVEVRDIIDGVNDFEYTDYYSVDAPVGCSNRAGSSPSCWFAMVTDPSVNIHQRGSRGIIVRNFRGRLNGEDWPPADGDPVSPFTFNLIKSRQNGSAKNTVSIELGLPSSFQAAVDLGQAEFREGDFLSADIELLVPPRQNADYYGDSQRLRAWLTEAGVDESFEEGWKIIAREATEGDAISTTVFEGDLERVYHPRVKVTCPGNEARFNVAIPDGMPGILPITVSGVGEAENGTPPGKLWRFDAGGLSWKPFASGAAYQLEKDVLDNSYTFVYSLSLEFENQSSGAPVTGGCEQFFFGEAPPADTNPPC